MIYRAHQGVTTKLAREVDDLLTHESPTANDITRFNVLYRQLEMKSSVLADLDKEIYSYCKLTELEGEIKESETVVGRIMEYKMKIEAVVNQSNLTEILCSEESPHVHSSDAAVQAAKPRLPKLVFPVFYGDVTQWTSFWDSYKSAVHENVQLSKVDKFNYLQGLLDGPAARSIKGLPLSEGNYDSVIEILKQRFNKPQLIISTHMDKLVKIPCCNMDQSHTLKVVYDKITVHIRGLSALGVGSDQYGSLLIPIIMSKMPNEIRLRIAHEAKDDVWKIEDLMTIIKVEVEARETSEVTKFKSLPGTSRNNPPHNSHTPTVNAFAAQTHNIRCVYCDSQHFSASCDKVKGIKDRKDILIKSGRCFNCLKLNHKTCECLSTKTSRRCHGKQHQSICKLLSPQDEPVMSPAPANPEAEKVNTHTTNNIGTKTVLLQTAKAVAFNEHNNSSMLV